MRVHCIAALVLVACADVLAQEGRPTFAEPNFPASKACPQAFKAIRAPGNQMMSILRVAKSKGDKDFLEVGAGRTHRDRSECQVEIRFEKPLSAAEVVSIDIRIAEFKDPSTSVSYVVGLGRQEHKLQYGRGRWMDGSPGSDLKRFLVPASAGTKAVRIKFAGSASSQDRVATAIVAVDSMDLCVLDPANPEACGVSGRPNQSAPAASAPP